MLWWWSSSSPTFLSILPLPFSSREGGHPRSFSSSLHNSTKSALLALGSHSHSSPCDLKTVKLKKESLLPSCSLSPVKGNASFSVARGHVEPRTVVAELSRGRAGSKGSQSHPAASDWRFDVGPRCTLGTNRSAARIAFVRHARIERPRRIRRDLRDGRVPSARRLCRCGVLLQGLWIFGEGVVRESFGVGRALRRRHRSHAVHDEE